MTDRSKRGSFDTLIPRAIARYRQGMDEAHASSWRAEFDGATIDIWHYGTRMLRAYGNPDHGWMIEDWDLGHGSVTDQQGMNRLFRALGYTALRYRRDAKGGGPRIEETVRRPTQVVVESPDQLELGTW